MKIKLTPVGKFTKVPILENVRAVFAIDDKTADIQYLDTNSDLKVERVNLDEYSMVFYS